MQSINKAEFIKAASENPQLVGFLDVNEQALARAKASNTLFEAKGIVFVRRTI